MKKIAFVLDSGLRGGGAERVAAELLTNWAGQGAEVTLISMVNDGPGAPNLAPAVRRIVTGGAVRSRNRLKGFFRNLVRVHQLRRAIIRTGAPVVVSFLTSSNVRLLVSSTGLGRRIVISERNDVSRQRHPWPWRLARRAMYRHADVVTANSQAALEAMAAYVPREKLALVPNPVKIPSHGAVPSNSKTILNVGRLVPHKGQAALLGAFAAIAAEFADWDLVILGDGPDGEALRAETRERGLADRVQLPGFVKDPSPYYRAAGVFVLPSRYEGTSNALLEAMAHGIPCLVSDCLPGALEHVEHGRSGMVFSPDDPSELAGKLRQLISTPAARQQIGAAGRERMRELALDNVLETWERVLWLRGTANSDKQVFQGATRRSPRGSGEGAGW